MNDKPQPPGIDIRPDQAAAMRILPPPPPAKKRRTDGSEAGLAKALEIICKLHDQIRELHAELKKKTDHLTEARMTIARLRDERC